MGCGCILSQILHALEHGPGKGRYSPLCEFSALKSMAPTADTIPFCGNRTDIRKLQNIAATALFLANKVEENCRKTKDIIIAVAKVAQKNAKLIIDEQSKEYWRWRDSILTYEEVMLEQLTFDLMIDNPYRHLFDLLGQLDIVHNKHLRQAAWAFCNDACLTALPLLIEARDVAIASIFFASVHTNQPIDDIENEPWWKYLKGDEDRCAKAIEVIRQFYTENPLRKQNPSLPSPAFDLEVSRRRGDTLASQNETSSSNAPSPMELDRRSRSPRANGGAERDDVMNDRSTDPSSQGRPVIENNAPKSPLKRKEAELDTGSTEADRADKRARLSEDEEGELVED
jgi:protein BUR2